MLLNYHDMNMKLHSDLDQKNEQHEEQKKTIQALKQEIKPQVEKMDIGVQFNFLVPASGIHVNIDSYHAL